MIFLDRGDEITYPLALPWRGLTGFGTLMKSLLIDCGISRQLGSLPKAVVSLCVRESYSSVSIIGTSRPQVET